MRIARERGRSSARAVAAVEHVLVGRREGTDGAREVDVDPGSRHRRVAEVQLAVRQERRVGPCGIERTDRLAVEVTRPADVAREAADLAAAEAVVHGVDRSHASRTCSSRCDPRSRDHRHGCPTPSGCSRSTSNAYRPAIAAQSAGSVRAVAMEVRERARDPRADQAVPEGSRRVPIGLKFPSPSGSPTAIARERRVTELGEHRSAHAEPDDEEVMLQLGAALHAFARVDSHLDPRHPRVDRVDVDRPTSAIALLAAAREIGRAPIGVVEEDRVTQLTCCAAGPTSRRSPTRPGSLPSRRAGRRRTCTSRTSSPAQATYGMFASIGSPASKRSAPDPADAVLDIARAASAPSDASTSTSFSFVRILVFPPLVDTQRMCCE